MSLQLKVILDCVDVRKKKKKCPNEENLIKTKETDHERH